MSLLQFGVAPKMKPISRKRAALVAALDVGTSKVVCMIAQAGAERRQRRAAAAQPFDRGDRLRPYRGARHEGRQRGRSRCRRPCDPACGRTRRAIGGRASGIGRGLDFGRTVIERTLHRLGGCRRPLDPRRRYRAAAAGRQPAFRTRRAGWCCIRCRSAMPSTASTGSGIRAACWRAASASTCMW